MRYTNTLINQCPLFRASILLSSLVWPGTKFWERRTASARECCSRKFFFYRLEKIFPEGIILSCVCDFVLFLFFSFCLVQISSTPIFTLPVSKSSKLVPVWIILYISECVLYSRELVCILLLKMGFSFHILNIYTSHLWLYCSRGALRTDIALAWLSTGRIELSTKVKPYNIFRVLTHANG